MAPHLLRNGSPPGQGRSRTARRRRARQGGVALSKPGFQMSATVPNRLVTRRRAYTQVTNPGYSSQYGDDIVVVEGSQNFNSVANSAASANLFTSANVLTFSPDSVGGTLAGIANRYNKYFFTDIAFEFVPYQPNSTDGHGFAFGFNHEGVTDFTVDFSNVSTLEDSMVLPMTGFLGGPEMNTLRVCPSRKTNPWFWNEVDQSGGNAELRQTLQGKLYGVADSAITNATTWGTIWLHYRIEFADITPDQGFTLRQLRVATRDDPDFRRKALAILEGVPDPDAPRHDDADGYTYIDRTTGGPDVNRETGRFVVPVVHGTNSASSGRFGAGPA